MLGTGVAAGVEEAVAEVFGSPSKEDRADLGAMRRAIAGYLDRVAAGYREDGDELTAHGAIHTFVQALTGDSETFIAQAWSAGLLEAGQVPPAGMDFVRRMLVATAETLLELDSHDVYDRIREFGAAARRAGRERDDMRIYVTRMARLVIACHERDCLAPLVDVEAVIEAWWALLEAWLALAALTAAVRPTEPLRARDEALGARCRHREARDPPPSAFCRSHPLQRHAPPPRARVSTVRDSPRGPELLRHGTGGALAPT